MLLRRSLEIISNVRSRFFSKRKLNLFRSLEISVRSLEIVRIMEIFHDNFGSWLVAAYAGIYGPLNRSEI